MAQPLAGEVWMVDLGLAAKARCGEKMLNGAWEERRHVLLEQSTEFTSVVHCLDEQDEYVPFQCLNCILL